MSELLDEPAVLGYAEAAKLLRISERTLARYVREGRVPYVKLPQRGAWAQVRFLRNQLLVWLEKQSVKPTQPRNRIQGAA